jgi:hypothetical protein
MLAFCLFVLIIKKEIILVLIQGHRVGSVISSKVIPLCNIITLKIYKNNLSKQAKCIERISNLQNVYSLGVEVGCIAIKSHYDYYCYL